MISWHRMGQFVTPKEDTPWHNHSNVGGDLSGPKFGDVLSIAHVQPSRLYLDRIVFLFAEYPGKTYGSEDFEPVYPQALDRLRGLLAPTLEEKRPFLEEIIADRVAGLPV